jgi:hypothetical protein
MTINCKGILVDLYPKVMGILNDTQLFFDGGKYKNETEIYLK